MRRTSTRNSHAKSAVSLKSETDNLQSRMAAKYKVIELLKGQYQRIKEN